LARCWRWAGDLHLQLGIATGGEPDPWPDAAQRAKDKDKVAAGWRIARRMASPRW
jgi:hypothetical protein